MEKIQAKKKFGQNFLKDDLIKRQIIEAMPNTKHALAEIGPGLGDLTKLLLSKKDVVAFEVDTELCDYLSKQFADEIDKNRLEIRCGDVLDRWSGCQLLDAPYDLVANLPYYIATNIILKALEDVHCKNMLVMVQKEVAEKFCAQCEEKSFSSLSVITQSIAKAKIVIDVPPSAFDPMPKVDSAVMLISKFKDRSNKGFEDFLKIAFKAPRKTLSKNLSNAYDKTKIATIFQELGLTPTIRPHQTTTQNYHLLYQALH